MFDDNLPAQDMPLDEFIQHMAECGFDWVKRIGHVHVHVFEHRVTQQPVVIMVNGEWLQPPMSNRHVISAASSGETRDRPFDAQWSNRRRPSLRAIRSASSETVGRAINCEGL